jgi:hypothetical protein
MGANIDERIAAARLVPARAAPLYPGANLSFAPRFGFGYELLPNTGILLRGGFGIFYDQIFDNLWLNARNNSFVFPPGFTAVPSDYLEGVASVLPLYSGQSFSSPFPNLTAFQKPLPNPYAENWFLGVQRQSGSWVVELNGVGSLGRRLLTSDVLNRQSAQNTSLPAITWIAGQGLSDYYGLAAHIRWRWRSGFLQAAYTWSHAIDNQSDPLSGDLFNLLFVNPGPNEATAPQAGFSRAGDSNGDRGNSDFDQRHTFVFDGAFRPRVRFRSAIGKLFNDLTFAGLGAIRSGFPYTIYTQVTNPQSVNARARVIGPSGPLLASPVPVSGGLRIFDPSAFCPSDACDSPETGRNVFAGPGLINFDASVSRSISCRPLGEGGQIVLRADSFNVLNHANLNPPGNMPGAGSYGVALWGTPPAGSGFPALVPLTETSRRVQLTLRVTF